MRAVTPTQLIKSFSLVFNPEFRVLKNTPKGLITNTTIANKTGVTDVSSEPSAKNLAAYKATLLNLKLPTL